MWHFLTCKFQVMLFLIPQQRCLSKKRTQHECLSLKTECEVALDPFTLEHFSSVFEPVFTQLYKRRPKNINK